MAHIFDGLLCSPALAPVPKTELRNIRIPPRPYYVTTQVSDFDDSLIDIGKP